MSLCRRFFICAVMVTVAAIAVPPMNLHAAGQSTKALTNQDVSDMHRAGLSRP